MINKYRRKPVVLEALKFEYTEEGIAELKAYLGDKLGNIRKERHPDALGAAEIKTLEDAGAGFKVIHIATEGDYIVRGINGEFWAVKPDIFELTYEQVYTYSAET